MKKLFLTSGVLMCMACPTIANADSAGFVAGTGANASIQKTTSGGTTTYIAKPNKDGNLTDISEVSTKTVQNACVYPILGGESTGSTTLKADWTKNWYEITLNPNVGTGANQGGATGTASKPTTLYAVHGDSNVYKTRTTLSDGTYSFSNPVAANSAILTTNPTGGNVNYTLDYNWTNISNQTGVTYTDATLSQTGNSAGNSVAAARTFKGFFDTATSAAADVNIGSDKKLKSHGSNAASGATTDLTWVAQYNSATPTVTNPTLKGYTFGGWSTDAACSSTLSSFATTTSKTIHACWTPVDSSITLNKTLGSANSNPATLYTRYDVGAFLTSSDRNGYKYSPAANTNKVMTKTANGLTSVPTASGVTVSYNLHLPTNPSTNALYTTTGTNPDVSNVPTSTTVNRVFTGFYNNKTTVEGLGDNGSGTPMIDENGKITDAGIAAAKAISSTTAVNWYAGWNGGTHTLASEPSLTGYTFDGWWWNADGTGDKFTPGTTWNPLVGKELHAKWTANKYSVTYNKGNGNGTTWKHTDGATFDSNYSLPTSNTNYTNARPAKTGYTFIGWTTASTNQAAEITRTGDTTGTIASATAFNGATPWKRTSDLTVYAAYQANRYTITYNCGTQPGSTAQSGTVPTANKATYDSSYQLATNTCAYAGFSFNGWSCTQKLNSNDADKIYSDGETVTTFNYAGAVTCSATWTNNDITITWDGNNANSTWTTPQGGDTTCTYDGDVKLPTNPTRTGYTFNGWLVANN